jgi:hypothetical protein
MSTPGLEKLAFTWQPRPHWPQKWQAARPLWALVRIDSRDGMHVTPRRSLACLTSSS